MPEPLVSSTHVLINSLDNVASVTNLASEGFGGASIITIYDAYTAAGYGWLPSDSGIRSNRPHALGSSTLSGFILSNGSEFRGVASIDGSLAAGEGKRLFYTHHYSSQGSALNTVANVADDGYGYMFFLFSASNTTDRTANVRGWCNGGRDSVPTLFAPTPTSFICVDPTYTPSAVLMGAGAVQLDHIDVVTAGNEFDPANIESAGWGTVGNNTVAGDNVQTVSRLGYYDAYTLYSGEISNPATFRHVYDSIVLEKLYAMAVGDGEQYRARAALNLGARTVDGVTQTYILAENGSINFATKPSSLTVPKIRFFHADDNKIGLEERFISGDIAIFDNYQLASGTPWHLRMDSSIGADIQFNNCVIQNSGGSTDDIEINSDVTINGGLIDSCGEMTVNAGTIIGATISNPVSTSGLLITTASNLKDLVFNLGSAAETSFGLRLPDPAGATINYTFDNFKYIGFDFSVRVEGSTGTVNIFITNGGDIPSISAGILNVDTPVLLGAGWSVGTTYTAEASGTKRCVFVVISNDGSKLANSCTFGGVSMILAESQLQDTIGTCLFYLVEENNSAVFTGSQAIVASYAGGDPANITYQRATYNNIRQINSKKSSIVSSNSKIAGASSVSVLNAWQSAAQVTGGQAFTISAGSNRALVVIVNHEDNGSSPGASGVTYGGQAMTLVTNALVGQQSSQIFILNEAGIAAAVGTNIIISGTVGDNPSYGAASFSGVDQTDFPKDFDSITGENPSITTLSLTSGDMVIGSFTSSSGASTSAWTGELATPDASFGDNLLDDPNEGAYKAYTGSTTTTGAVGATGGLALRTSFCTIVLTPPGNIAGELSNTIDTLSNDLVLSIAQISELTADILWVNDGTERLETDRTNETVAIADFIQTVDGTATMAFSNTVTTVGVDSQLVTAVFKPSVSFTSAPTVNILSIVDVDVLNLVTSSSYRLTYADDLSLIEQGTQSGDFQILGVIANDTPESLNMIVRKYGYQEYLNTVTHNNISTIIFISQIIDINISELDQGVVAAYPIVTDFVAKTITTSASVTKEQIYDAVQLEAAVLANLSETNPLTTADGVNFILDPTWKLVISTEIPGGLNLTGNLDLSGVFNVSNINLTGSLTFTTAGTYAISNSVIDEVIDTSGGAIIINSVDTTITLNSSPGNITINNAVSIFVKVVNAQGFNIENARVRLVRVSDSSIILEGLTDVNGEISTTFNFTSPIAITGWVRKSSASPYYVQGNVTGNITSIGFSTTIQMQSDE